MFFGFGSKHTDLNNIITSSASCGRGKQFFISRVIFSAWLYSPQR